MPILQKPVLTVAGLVLLLDGIGLSAFCLGADRLGFGQGYGFGQMQLCGLSAGILLSIAGLSVLIAARRRSES